MEAILIIIIIIILILILINSVSRGWHDFCECNKRANLIGMILAVQ